MSEYQWKTVSVVAFDELMQALDRADRKGYMPDAIKEEWEAFNWKPEQPAQQEPVAWLELLREARDNCKASIVEEGISASRKEYRIDLESRLTAALNTSPPTLSLAQRQQRCDIS